jgi:ribosomal protein S18 acetylase RimI-like enzyme
VSNAATFVRAARGADAPAVARVARRAATAVYEGTVDDPAILDNLRSDGFAEGLREHLDRIPDRDGYCYLVAGEPVAGFAQFVWAPMDTDPFIGPDECLLHSLYVQPDRWGEGLGTALLDAGIERLPEDCTALGLAVLRSNDLGIRFYESYGFERTAAGETTVAGATYPCYVYSLSLA